MLESKKNLPAPLQVSKWIKLPLLIDAEEMQGLIDALPPFKLYDVQKVNSVNSGVEAPTYLVEGYRRYVSHLQKGETPPLDQFRGLFSAAWSVTDEAFFSVAIDEGRRLFKAITPIVQTQMNQIRYAPEEKVFRTQVFGPDTLCWGIQIGFPHLFLDPTSYEALSTREFPNMALFNAVQRWVRQNTVPTPFIVEGEKLNSPIRLGKKCFSWIASHPQLKALGISIDRA